MLKNLTILALAGALLPACIITTDNSTDGASISGATENTGSGTDGSGTDGSGTDGSGTDSGATDGTGGSTSVPTTGEPTSSTGGSTDQGTTGSTTGQGSEYGMCGWLAAEKYYGCAFDGADPGVSDPEGIDPIGCPEGLNVGDPCSDQDGPVTNIGCCTATGDNYYCSGDVIVILPCGA